MDEIIITNPKEFAKKKWKLIKGGAKSLHIASDFDKTLSKAFRDGKKVNTVIAQIRYGDYLMPGYAEKAFALFDKYHPIEIDPKIPKKEKILKMEEWWGKHIQLMAQSGLTQQLVKKIVSEKNIPLREGALEFLRVTARKKIPCLILSAALGDFIEEMLKQEKALSPNIHVISNFFEFDKKGSIKGYKGKIIHSLNKHETEIKNTAHFEAIKGRHNILLLGDSLDDLDMVKGIPHTNILSVAFLNEETQANTQEYRKKYDVLVLNDGSMEFANKLLEEIN